MFTMLCVKYRNLVNLYPDIPKIFNLETAAEYYGSTRANVSIATFYVPKGVDFIRSGYLEGIPVEDFDSIPYQKIRGLKVTTPIRTLQDLFEYEDLVDPQVTFDFVPWFAVNTKLDPMDFLDEAHHEEVKGILEEGWSHGNF